jgi:FkbM family methyltransferase
MMHLIDRYFLKQPLIRRFFTRLLAGEREAKVSLLAKEYQVHTLREHGLFRAAKLAATCSLFRDEIPVLIHLASIVADGDTFLDIGANVGIFAASIGQFRMIYPKLKVYAFEPNPDTARRLRANVEPLGAKVFGLALSDRNGILEFVDGAVSNVFTTIENASSYSISHERTLCECRRLDDIEIDGNALVMKIDVEGQEWEVLQGALSYFRSNRVKALYLDDYKDPRVRNLLDEYGFHCFNGRTLETATRDTKHLLAVRPHAKIL